MSRVDVGVEHVDTSNVQISTLATQKSTTVRSRGLRRFGDGSENAVRPMVGRGSTEGSAEQLKSVGRSNTPVRISSAPTSRLMLAPRPFRKRAPPPLPAQLSFPRIYHFPPLPASPSS